MRVRVTTVAQEKFNIHTIYGIDIETEIYIECVFADPNKLFVVFFCLFRICYRTLSISGEYENAIHVVEEMLKNFDEVSVCVFFSTIICNPFRP